MVVFIGFWMEWVWGFLGFGRSCFFGKVWKLVFWSYWGELCWDCGYKMVGKKSVLLFLVVYVEDLEFELDGEVGVEMVGSVVGEV